MDSYHSTVATVMRLKKALVAITLEEASPGIELHHWHCGGEKTVCRKERK